MVGERQIQRGTAGMIRRYEDKDRDRLCDIWLKSNLEAHSFIPEKYWRDNLGFVRKSLHAAEVYVYENDKICGFIGLSDFQNESGERSGKYIEGLFVDATERNKSIGKKLLDFAKQNNERLFLSVYEKNKGALSFYLREGFRAVKENEDVNTGEKELFMEFVKDPCPPSKLTSDEALRVEKIERDKKRFLHLLLMADEEEHMLDKYLERGDMYVLFSGSKTLGEIVVTREAPDVLEIKNLAVAPDERGKGYGRYLIDFVGARYEAESREKHPVKLLVGTGDSPATLPFYEKCGFLRSHVIKDFFTENYSKPIYDGGVLLKDMVYLKKNIL